jgi:hypothetical protein
MGARLGHMVEKEMAKHYTHLKFFFKNLTSLVGLSGDGTRI